MDLPLQPLSHNVWDDKYRLKSNSGEPVDQTIADTYARVAKALAVVEAKDQAHWEERFRWALENGATPGGRVISNAGAGEHKSAVSLINCTVSETIPDSMRGILKANLDAGLTLKAGAGIGYDFSTLRPKGAAVRGAGSSTSGPLSFMEIFNATCNTVSSAGARRGAQMACMDIGHPDVLDFIRAKRKDGAFRAFNFSVLITAEFVEAVKSDAEWAFAFPASADELATGKVELIYRPWPLVSDAYRTDERGRVAMCVYRRMPARRVWSIIMRSTYEYAEPGFILIDRVNQENNLWFAETIRATNPCGEQPLPPGGSCLLGSINLTRFVDNPFAAEARFDWERFRQVVGVFTRMLDNVVEIHGLPLDVQGRDLCTKRRHGMGFFGLGSAMTMLGWPYGSPESLKFADEVARQMALEGWRQALALSLEKGPAPIMHQSFPITEMMLTECPALAEAGYKVGDHALGRELHTASRHLQRIAELDPTLVEQLRQYGARFTHHTSIAPTGTTALSLGNNASNGVEPSFSHCTIRNILVPGKKAKEACEVLSFEFLAYRALVDVAATPDSLPQYFSTSDVAPSAHIAVQAAVQRWVDGAISKTINVPTDIPFDQFENIYLEAIDAGLKGCTTFRFNPAAHQGVLVKREDLRKVRYRFRMEDGSTLEVKGDECVEYEGESPTAANLFDALKEGYYGTL